MQKLTKDNTNLILVELVKDQPITTSLLVAEKFKKSHKFVLEKIRNLKCSPEFIGANFRPIFYQDSYSREQDMYEITEEGFMFIAMRFTGELAVEWQEKFIKAFQQTRKENEQLRKQQLNKNWLEAREAAKTSFKFMNTMLLDSRTEQGKDTKSYHYSNEARLVNYALTGEYKGINRGALSDEDLSLLFDLQALNSKLIVRDVEYQERKSQLTDYADNFKALLKNKIAENLHQYQPKRLEVVQ